MATVDTLYGPVAAEIMQSLSEVKLFACDVDGVFSDGRIYLGNHGEEYKAFHTRDGYGIKAIISAGVQVAVITGRRSEIVSQRMNALGVQHIIQGEEQKAQALQRLQKELGLKREQTASIGDDCPDLGMFEHSQLAIATQDAHPQVCRCAGYITQNKGGFGAVREICDLLLQSKNVLDQVRSSSV